MFSRRITGLALSLVSSLSLAIAQDSSSSLRDVLGAQQNLTSFANLLTGQFPETLKAIEDLFEAGSNPVTILAPSNRAFDSLVYDPQLNDAFSNNNTEAISQIIAYHVLLGSWTTKTLHTSFTFIPSMTSGTNFSAVSDGQRVGAVLQNAANNSNYEYEIVFVSGQSTRSVVTFQDIPFAGGIIQVIDNFLIPPIPLVPSAETFNLADPPYAINSFLGAIYSTPNKALQRYLNDTSDITVFVPANIAFELVAEAITTMPDARRLDLLSYHIYPSLIYSSSFANATQLTMLSNQTAELTFYPNSFFLNSARIVQSDILIYNGVMHVIDVVLDPSAANTLPNPTSATQMPVLQTGVPPGQTFNATEAPFTTFLPNFVPSETPTTSVDEAALASVTSDGATTTPTTAVKKSAATRIGGQQGWAELGSLWVGIAMVSSVLFATSW